jgi:hypothetical protein
MGDYGMTLSLIDAVLGIILSAALLFSIILLTIKGSEKVYPVLCIHCWRRKDQKTIVSHSHQEGEWAICRQCVKQYWLFED